MRNREVAGWGTFKLLAGVSAAALMALQPVSAIAQDRAYQDDGYLEHTQTVIEPRVLNAGGSGGLRSRVPPVVPGGAAAGAPPPNLAQMWSMIQQQQAEIERLKTDAAVKAAAPAAGGVADAGGLAAGLVGGATPVVAGGTAALPADAAGLAAGIGPGAPGDAAGLAAGLVGPGFGASTGWWTRTSMGGYGELHYNNGDTNEVDLHRFVLFINHDFNDWIKLYSEFEIEHVIAGEGKNGEVEMEQAYLHFSIKEDRFGPLANIVSHVNLGLQLVPVGIINETHEPPTFYGTERNDVEKRIVPATWWEAGALAGGKLGKTGIFWDVMAHSGLDNTGDPGKIRSGRQKVSKATSDNPAFTGRLGWQYKGIQIAGSIQKQTDITPGDAATVTQARLVEMHANINQPVTDWFSVGLRALYARWDVEGVAAQASGRDKLDGWYIEPSVKFDLKKWGAVGFFFRHETWDEKAGDATASVNLRRSFGANYWPDENVVLKIDFRNDSNDDGARGEDDRVDFGLGFQF